MGIANTDKLEDERIWRRLAQFDSAIFGIKMGPKVVQSRDFLKRIFIPRPSLNSMSFLVRFLKKKNDQIQHKTETND